MYDKVILVGVDNSPIFPIKVRRKDGCLFALTKFGQFSDSDYAKCVIFPKGKTTWEGFVQPCKFKDGDIVITTLGNIAIIRKHVRKVSFCIYGIMVDNNFYKNKVTKVCVKRLATEEEKQKLFQAIKDNGYKWNEETKTLEKLIEPKFKVGDRIRHKCPEFRGERTITSYGKSGYWTSINDWIDYENQDDWELVPNKFDITTLVPFESRVLVRNDEKQFWIPAFWGCKRADGYTTTLGWCKYCIPFEGNEHLLETNNDCDEYFKTWE